jgi:hypothetical protein
MPYELHRTAYFIVQYFYLKMRTSENLENHVSRRSFGRQLDRVAVEDCPTRYKNATLTTCIFACFLQALNEKSNPDARQT